MPGTTVWGDEDVSINHFHVWYILTEKFFAQLTLPTNTRSSNLVHNTSMQGPEAEIRLRIKAAPNVCTLWLWVSALGPEDQRHGATSGHILI